MTKKVINQALKFCVINLGCRVNAFEATVITDMMIDSGFVLTDEKDAEIFIVNTCTVTARADAKVRNTINKINRNKNKQILVIIGCYSQINYQYAALHGEIVLGNKFKNQIPELINQYLKERKPIVKVDNLAKERNFEENPVFSFCENTRAVIKIQDGCDFMCSYCLIPYARGRQRSLAHTKVIDTIKKLVQTGFYEIVLTGVNTAGYKDENGYTFYDLLKDINGLEGKFRVRISSIEPFQINHDIIDLVVNNKRFVQEFHLCIQNANDEVLKVMNRKYTVKDFIALCDYIRCKNPLMSITTDYIVGYSNETQEFHTNAIENLKQIKFAFMNIFPYSERKNTAASFTKSIVSDTEKFNRTKEITKLANTITHEYLKQFINETVDVYFEYPKNPNVQQGHSQYFFMVYIPHKQSLQHQLHQVKITKVDVDNKVYGELITSC
ncbi:MAG: threonylcarbamoyladenosine tRNA methylthiotransferase MtaB [Candidatus Malacoplasma girerdii]|nr:MAG: threonylcarbamoyladenosine tRNA methylthiotransferase MtaB [Candidatus Malacoplasma girerdii]